MRTRLSWSVTAFGSLFGVLVVAALGRAGPAPDLEPSGEAKVTAEGLFYSVLDKNSSLGPLPGGWTISAQRVERGELLRPILRHKDARGQTDVIIMAEKGALRVDAKRRAAFLHLQQADFVNSGGALGWFEDRVLTFTFPRP